MKEFNLQVKELTPSIIERFKTAISIGKWPDGRLVNDEQKEILTQAIIIYDNSHAPVGQRIGDLEEDSCFKKKSIKKVDSDISRIESQELKWQKKTS